MNRRNVLKMAGITLVTTAVSVQAKEEPVAEMIMNRMKMKVQDPAKPTDHELKHLPQITIKEKDAKGYTVVEILLGQKGIIHPSTPNHWIDFIELYADDKLVGKNVLEADISSGATLFSVKLDGVKTLTSHAGCNLHGIWTASVKV
ncbi:MAG: Twin-arginine translocation pathway signal protein [uncultured Sulfurovum sp.]|uniref:Twin-arginine translocation pathway signal protein n=1 Tax=uncultured Sulfurovum sp. TaxID=269237 RepID=A0A6S6SY95_9BACT|nr:MAG: Twin-arginine translocation pathway signal protein [uncultured Sulfurovum sp.]